MWYICSDVSETHVNTSITLHCIDHKTVISRCSGSCEVMKAVLNIIEIGLMLQKIKPTCSTEIACTRWFKYERDWFVCKQAALRSSCATLREWSHNLHHPSCSGYNLFSPVWELLEWWAKRRYRGAWNNALWSNSSLEETSRPLKFTTDSNNSMGKSVSSVGGDTLFAHHSSNSQTGLNRF